MRAYNSSDAKNLGATKQGLATKKVFLSPRHLTSLALTFAAMMGILVYGSVVDAWAFGTTSEATFFTEVGALFTLIAYFSFLHHGAEITNWTDRCGLWAPLKPLLRKTLNKARSSKEGAINEPRQMWDKRLKFNKDMQHLAKNGEADEVDKLIAEMSTQGLVPCATSYLHMVVACIKANDIVRADQWLPLMINPGVGHGAGPGFLHTVIDACLQAFDAEQAVSCFHKFVDMNRKPVAKTFLAVFQACSKDTRGDAAVTFFKEMLAKGYEMDISCWQAMLDHSISRKDPNVTEYWFGEMLKAGCLAEGPCYTAVIRVCAQKRDVNRAEIWLTKMIRDAEKRDLTLDTAGWNAVLHACARNSDPDRAEKWIMSMARCKLKGRTPSGKIRPDVVSYATLLDACAEAGDTTRALKWWNHMQRLGMPSHAVTFNTLMKAHSKAGDLEGTIKWLNKAEEVGLQDALGYNAVIAAAGRAGKPEDAKHWLARMTRLGYKADIVSYNSVIHAWAKAGNAAKAEEVLSAMRAKGIKPDTVSLGAVFHACAKAGDIERAQSIITSELAKGARLDSVSYNALIDVFARAGDMKNAEVWLQRMYDDGRAPGVVAYTTVLQGHARHGEMEIAEKCMERMMRNGVQPNVVTYTAMISAFAKTGNIARAEEWFARMVEAGVQPNFVTFSTIMNVCAKAADLDRAEFWFEQMGQSDEGRSTVCYNNVIDACVKAGQPKRAEGWMKSLRASGLELTSTAYKTTALGFAVKGDVNRTEGVLMQMEEDGLALDAHCLDILLTVYSKCHPPLRDTAVQAVTLYANKSIPITNRCVKSLTSLLGPDQVKALRDKLGLQVVSDRNHDMKTDRTFSIAAQRSKGKAREHTEKSRKVTNGIRRLKKADSESFGHEESST